MHEGSGKYKRRLSAALIPAMVIPAVSGDAPLPQKIQPSHKLY
jgi:hypothetical protein